MLKHSTSLQFTAGVQNQVPKTKLSDLAVPRISGGMHWDSLLPAFGVRVGKTRRTFLLIQNGGHRITLGHYGSLSLAQAREKARSLMQSGNLRPGAFADVLDAYI